MSLKQRRDHKPVPDSEVDNCRVCAERIHRVYDRNNRVSSRRYWRHIRRWNKKP